MGILIKTAKKQIKNLDEPTVEGFGEEWAHFDQSKLTDTEREKIFQDYFGLFPWHLLPASGAVGLDAGCGSGRWGQIVASKVKKLYLLDASLKALSVARNNLSNYSNVTFIHKPIEEDMLPEASLDFAYSLGVLHHLPDPQLALSAIAKTLKPGAPLLVYLYYDFDNRPFYYKWLWKISDMFRWLICRSPFSIRLFFCNVIAGIIYWPFARMSLVLERLLGKTPVHWPLEYYKNESFYTMRTDALDRFGTRLETRFSKNKIQNLLEKAGFEKIVFSEAPPYWCAVGLKCTI